MYENEWNYVGKNSVYDKKAEKGAQFFNKFSLFIENTLRKLCLMVYFCKKGLLNMQILLNILHLTPIKI